MKRDVHYVIKGEKISEDKAEVRRALKRGAEVDKVIYITYQTGPTRVTVSTTTTITKIADV